MRRFNDFWVLPLIIIETCAFANSSTDTFEVKGNERTRTKYIQEIAEKCLELIEIPSPKTTDELAKLNQCIMNAKLFAEVKLERAGEKITITVDEKWTLIPAPFFQSSGSTRKFGLIVFETNFLGQGLTLALGGNSSNKGSGFFGFFTNPSIASSQWFNTISASKESTIYELIERREAVSYSFLEKDIGGTFGLGYRFPWISLSANLGRTVKEYEEDRGYAPPKAYSVNTSSVTVDFDKRDYKLYFSDGYFARYRVTKSFAESTNAQDFIIHEASASWQHDVHSDHALNLMTSAYSLKGGNITDTERMGSKKGFRGIESNSAFAEFYFAQTVEYQIPLRRFEKGTLTTAVFADHGVIKNRGGEFRRVDYTAGGLGVYFFLSRIAIPGFGLEWGMNNEYQKSFTNFSIGMSY